MAIEPIDVACALIEREGRLLIAQRPPNKAQALKWEFPGGKVEHGEDARSALKREIAEELGMEIEIEEPLAGCVHDYGDFTIRLLPYVCAVSSGEPLPHEHLEVRWCTPGEIRAMDLAEADHPVLQNYVAWIQSGIDLG